MQKQRSKGSSWIIVLVIAVAYFVHKLILNLVGFEVSLPGDLFIWKLIVDLGIWVIVCWILYRLITTSIEKRAELQKMKKENLKNNERSE